MSRCVVAVATTYKHSILVALETTSTMSGFDFNKSFQSISGSVSELGSSFTPFAKRTQRLIQEKLGNADEKVRLNNELHEWR